MSEGGHMLPVTCRVGGGQLLAHFATGGFWNRTEQVPVSSLSSLSLRNFIYLLLSRQSLCCSPVAGYLDQVGLKIILLALCLLSAGTKGYTLPL